MEHMEISCKVIIVLHHCKQAICIFVNRKLLGVLLLINSNLLPWIVFFVKEVVMVLATGKLF